MATIADVDRIVCLTGPECTGKTTLAHALAERLGAALVPEVARDYLTGRGGYEPADLLEIARRQVAAEQEARALRPGPLVCDTDLLVIRIWWEEKVGRLPDSLVAALDARAARDYLLLAPDLPWVADSQRENPDDRDRLFDRYRAELERSGFPYGIVRGVGEARLACAVEQLERLVTVRNP